MTTAGSPKRRLRRRVSRRQALAGLGAAAATLPHGWAIADRRAPEISTLTVGFLPLSDMAPLAVARELGFFADEGLDITLEKQSSWRELKLKLEGGALAAAQTFAAHPLFSWARREIAPSRVVAAMAMGRNGNAVTVSPRLWSRMRVPRDPSGAVMRPVSAAALRPALADYAARREVMLFAIEDDLANSAYELRYWLAAGGVHPGFFSPDPPEGVFEPTGAVDAEIELMVGPPQWMPASLDAALVEGFSVGEPWGSQAAMTGVGVPVVADHSIWPFNPEKYLGMPEGFVDAAPVAAKALVKAVSRACKWLDATGTGAEADAEKAARRQTAVRLLERPEYTGAARRVLSASMMGDFAFGRGETQATPDFHVFFRNGACAPLYSDAVWFLTQMRRWGQIPEPQPDAWYDAVARGAFRPELYQAAVEELIDAGHFTAEDAPDAGDGFRAPSADFIDGEVFDGRAPTAYLERFAIGLKADQRVVRGRVVPR